MGPDGWMPGHIYRHHYVEDGWHHPCDFVAPYQVELENMDLENPFIYAQTDQDWCIRRAPVKKQGQIGWVGSGSGSGSGGKGKGKGGAKGKQKRDDVEPSCGLCGSLRGPFMLTACCGRRLCDTENEYEMGSYERDGQCARNHRLNTICGYHHNEDHPGDWQKCQKCEGDFHPFDYAVKATSMKVSCTERRYNFDDNVRGDLFPHSMCFPQCDVCGVPVDTTEETTRTLSMRRLSGQPPLCEQHGGGFGVIKPSKEGCKQS